MARGKRVCKGQRQWTIDKQPPEYGWFQFEISGSRKAAYVGPTEFSDDAVKHLPRITGYLVGDRLISDTCNASTDPSKVLTYSEMVFLVPLGLPRFSRIQAFRHESGAFVFESQLFPLGPEGEVLQVFEDRLLDLSGIPSVTPALELSFRFESWQRDRALERRRQAEERQRQEERRQQLTALIGTGSGRRELAQVDFEAAARAALLMSGAELLDVRSSYNPDEKVVRFRFAGRRFECVADLHLGLVDAGICLSGEDENGNDGRFQLENLPGVIQEAIDEGVLHVYRRVD